ncbi:MAG: ion transporter, partial [Desulfobacteraceae bacterium 4572_35.1]
MRRIIDNIERKKNKRAPWRNKLHEVIFEADTSAGKTFDVLLIICIIASVLAVVLESVSAIRVSHGQLLT